MCMYVYAHVYISAYIYGKHILGTQAHQQVSARKWLVYIICIHMYICIYMCIHIGIYIWHAYIWHTGTSASWCEEAACVYKYIHMYICICICIYISIHIWHAYICRTGTSLSWCERAACIYMINILLYVCTHICICIYISVYIYMYMAYMYGHTWRTYIYRTQAHQRVGGRKRHVYIIYIHVHMYMYWHICMTRICMAHRHISELVRGSGLDQRGWETRARGKLQMPVPWLNVINGGIANR